MFVSEVPGVWQRCFAGCTLRDTQWSTIPNQLWPPRGHACADETRGLSQHYLCFITLLTSPPKAGICALLGTICSTCKGAWKTAHDLAAPGNLHPFSRALMTLCLVTLKFPYSPLFGEKVLLELELPFSILWPLSKSLFCLHQTQFHYWELETEWERTPCLIGGWGKGELRFS